MSRNQRDREIRELFTRLRPEREASVPVFEQTLKSATPAHPLQRFKLAGALTALMAAAILVWQLASPPPPSEPVPMMLSEWRSPTDFLLRLPGDALLRSVPRLQTAPTHWEPEETKEQKEKR